MGLLIYFFIFLNASMFEGIHTPLIINNVKYNSL